MTANRRIFLNIIATCGRSLYAHVCGLFISRWVLQVPGKTDFGLYGVVGGMTIIVMFWIYVLRLWESDFTVAIKCDPVAPVVKNRNSLEF